MSTARPLRFAVAAVLVLPFGLAGALNAAGEQPAPSERYFAVRVVDSETGRGVPLVQLRTTNGIRYHTDSAGRVAIDEPGLMGRRVFFHVESPGYQHPKGGFGYRGRALQLNPGGSATLEIERTQVAERLYRVTGQGIYVHTARLGEPTPIERPLLNGRVMGQDSVQATVFKGRIRWFWGDTGRPGHPLGNFKTSGATSKLPEDGGLDPARGVNLRYFTNDKGFARPMLPMEKPGVVWIDGLLTAPDPEGRARMLAHYTRLEGLGKPLGHGIAVYDNEADRFEPLRKWPDDAPIYDSPGQAFRVQRGGRAYWYFASPYPMVRVRAKWSHLLDPTKYEAFTCLRPGSRFDAEAPKLHRNADGELVYGWKRNTAPLGPARQRRLIERGAVEPGELRFRTRDAATGEPVELHSGSVRWNPDRERWIMIAVRRGGEASFLGEVFYAEADRPEGPWSPAVRIATHPGYTFYNPVQHRFLDRDGGSTIFFEGTYTRRFSETELPTPRYDYNQIMYRLDLSDPRLDAARPQREADR